MLPRRLAPDLPWTWITEVFIPPRQSRVRLESLILLLLVTTSPRQKWVISVPAAFLGCGSHFSGSLSGIEPRFPVSRHNHGRPLPYHLRLMAQKLESSIPRSEDHLGSFSYKTLRCEMAAIVSIYDLIGKSSDADNSRPSLFQQALAIGLPWLYF